MACGKKLKSNWEGCRRSHDGFLTHTLLNQMDTVRSWLDANEVRRMAEELMESPPKNKIPQPDAGYDDFEGYTQPDTTSNEPSVDDSEPKVNTLARASVSSSLASAREMAEGSGMLQQSSSPKTTKTPNQSKPTLEKTPPIEPPQTDFHEIDPMQILQLSETWTAQFHLQSMVVITANDVVIFDTLGNPKLTQMAQKLAKSSSSAGHLFVRISAGSSLQVVPISTDQVTLTLGVLVSTALSTEQVTQLVEQASEKLI